MKTVNWCLAFDAVLILDSKNYKKKKTQDNLALHIGMQT